jgi:hypothetical protein
MLGVVMLTCNPSTQTVRQEDPEFQFNLDHIVRLSQKTKCSNNI